MTNQQLIKYAHIGILAVLLACGLVAVAVKGGIAIGAQNSNQNQNGNTNGNTNTGNANTQNRNSNRSNRNSGATGEQTGMANMSSQDRDFLMDAAMMGMMEVEAGRVATQNGTSDAVKQFGQRMVDEHSQANTELLALATSKGITLPTALDEKHRERATKLSNMTGAEFDREFAKMMVNDHKKAVSDFEKQSTRGADADLKAFAARMLPHLREHLQMAQTLSGNERGNSNRGGARNSNRNGNSNRP